MINEEAAEKINHAKDRGGRVICVGTTSCRTIESAADENGRLKACSGWTEIFIYPGYRFKTLDCLITTSICRSQLLLCSYPRWQEKNMLWRLMKKR